VLESLNHRSQLALTAPLALLLLAIPLALSAQTTGLPAATPTQPAIPLSHLYMHFLLYEAHLEHLDVAHPIVNPKGKPIKEHLRLKIGLSPAEWQSVSGSSLRIEASGRAIDALDRPLAEADRHTCHAQPAPCSPPNLPRLRALRKQREQNLNAEIQSLESSLGPDATAKLRNYLQTTFIGNVKIITSSSGGRQVVPQPAQAVSQ
jgi:hypothetical protein